jgi:hypothetical protein
MRAAVSPGMPRKQEGYDLPSPSTPSTHSARTSGSDAAGRTSCRSACTPPSLCPASRSVGQSARRARAGVAARCRAHAGVPAACGGRAKEDLSKWNRVDTPLLAVPLPADSLPPADVHPPKRALPHELADALRSRAPCASGGPVFAGDVEAADSMSGDIWRERLRRSGA